MPAEFSRINPESVGVQLLPERRAGWHPLTWGYRRFYYVTADFTFYGK